MNFKGSMELEYIAKMTIILVVVFVLSSIMFNISGGLKTKIMSFFGGNDEEVTGVEITRDSLNDASLATYIESCYRKNVAHKGDSVCYVINLRNVLSSSSISDAGIRSNLIDKNIDFEIPSSGSSKSVLIKYELLGNKVVVKFLG